MWLFHYFDFERIHDVLKSMNRCFLLNKSMNFYNRNGVEKGKSHTHFQRDEPSASVQIRTRKREKRTFFVPFILSEKNVSNLCYISVYSVLNKPSSYLDL